MLSLIVDHEFNLILKYDKTCDWSRKVALVITILKFQTSYLDLWSLDAKQTVRGGNFFNESVSWE